MITRYRCNICNYLKFDKSKQTVYIIYTKHVHKMIGGVEKESVREDPDKVALQVSLIKLKSFSIILLKHLESVKGENLPNDAEFIEFLWFCLNGIELEADDLRHMTSRSRFTRR